VDAEVVEDLQVKADEALAAIDEAPDMEALEALATSITKLPEAIKKPARERYRARRAFLSKGAKSAEQPA
jgi:hypothetical protein